MNQNYQVIIIGAGAAGLMCAISAAKQGRRVLVVDHANKLGKKILMSGGGRCNFTNYSIEPENYLCDNSHFCKSALSRYTQWDFISLVESYNIDYYDKGQGQLFCKSSSKDIRDMLVAECQKYKVRIQLKTSITSIEALPHKELIGQKSRPLAQDTFECEESSVSSRFNIATQDQKYACHSLVIATGGLSIPTMGASDFGYKIAQQFGHTIKPTRPALTPLTFDPKWLQKIANLPGNSLKVTVSCQDQSFTDDMLFTHKGLSGPAILQISSYWVAGLPLHINLLPDLAAMEWLQQSKSERKEIQLKTLLAQQFSQAIAEFICNEVGFNKKLKHLEIVEINQLNEFLTNWTIYPAGYEGYRVAEVTWGGVDTATVSSKTFESALQPGLFLIGEVLDVTGHLGGYNFQWAWASGHAAGKYV
jgi:predicted Rossmann fold flavoprotein